MWIAITFTLAVLINGCHSEFFNNGLFKYQGYSIEYLYKHGKLQYVIIYDKDVTVDLKKSSSLGSDIKIDETLVKIKLISNENIQIGEEILSLSKGNVYLCNIKTNGALDVKQISEVIKNDTEPFQHNIIAILKRIRANNKELAQFFKVEEDLPSDSKTPPSENQNTNQ